MPAGGGPASGTVTLLNEGSNTISVNALDDAGNTGGDSVMVILDTHLLDDLASVVRLDEFRCKGPVDGILFIRAYALQMVRIHSLANHRPKVGLGNGGIHQA